MKKNLKILIVAVLICATISIVITAQNTPGDENISESQVTNAINTFAQLVNSENAQSFGLQNAEELKSLKAGKQFTAYMMQLDDIKKYKAGDDVNTLIKKLPSVEVALTDANNRFVTSIEFTRVKDAWQASGFGATPDLKVLYNERTAIADSAINAGKLVRIPALHTNFVAITNSTGLNFIATEDNEYLGFKRGTIMSASDALSKLTQAANAYNGLPD